MISTGIYKVISIAFNFSVIIGSNSRRFDNTHKLAVYVASRETFIAINFYLLLLFAFLKFCIVLWLRNQSNVNLYQLTLAFFFLIVLAITFYGIPAKFEKLTCQAFNASLLLYRHIQSKKKNYQ